MSERFVLDKADSSVAFTVEEKSKAVLMILTEKLGSTKLDYESLRATLKNSEKYFNLGKPVLVLVPTSGDFMAFMPDGMICATI